MTVRRKAGRCRDGGPRGVDAGVVRREQPVAADIDRRTTVVVDLDELVAGRAHAAGSARSTEPELADQDRAANARPEMARADQRHACSAARAARDVQRRALRANSRRRERDLRRRRRARDKRGRGRRRYRELRRVGSRDGERRVQGDRERAGVGNGHRGRGERPEEDRAEIERRGRHRDRSRQDRHRVRCGTETAHAVSHLHGEAER